jgi:hypothetical protein
MGRRSVDPGTAAPSAKNVHAAPGLPNQPANDTEGRNPMVDTATPEPWSLVREQLTFQQRQGTGEAYAFGFLASAAWAYLDGQRSTEYLRTLLANLESALDGDVR